MAFTVSSLTNFTDETQLKQLVRTLYTPKTASLLKAAGQVIPGIKSAKALPILESTVYPQAAGCGWQASGNTAFTQRTLTVKEAVFMDALCPTTLETKYLQLGLPAGTPEDLGVFQEQIANEISDTIADWIEPRLWTGSASNPGEWDGFATILTALSFGGAGDPVKGNPTTGGGYTQITAMTKDNIDEALEEVWALIPVKVKSKNDVVCFMGNDWFDLAVTNLKNANLFHYTPEAATDRQMVWPGTSMRLIGVPGLNSANVMIAGRIPNFFLGTDMANEEEQFDMWYSKDNREVRWNVNFKYGCQIAFPAETVYFTLP